MKIKETRHESRGTELQKIEEKNKRNKRPGYEPKGRATGIPAPRCRFYAVIAQEIHEICGAKCQK